MTDLGGLDQIRYAQCWEDADVLLQALAIAPHHRCLSIASAGDNTLAMVAQGPKQVVAVDINPAQIACLELRVAAYRCLTHPQLLKLLGSCPAAPQERYGLYQACRPRLSRRSQTIWDAYPQAIALGFGAVGRFERYLALFRRWVLPLIHSPAIVEQLFAQRAPLERQEFYRSHWSNWRWRLLFRIFFSRWLQGRLGREPRFLRYAQGDLALQLLARTQTALTTLSPVANSYLQWIALGYHSGALPYALRPENFAAIRDNLDCLTWHCCSLETFLRQSPQGCDRYNLSNVFEYMSVEQYYAVLSQLAVHSTPLARLVYWNLFAPRQCPPQLETQWRSLTPLQQQLNHQDHAFFYQTIVIEEHQNHQR